MEARPERQRKPWVLTGSGRIGLPGTRIEADRPSEGIAATIIGKKGQMRDRDRRGNSESLENDSGNYPVKEAMPHQGKETANNIQV